MRMRRQRMSRAVAVADRVAQLVDRGRPCSEQGDCAHRERSVPHRHGILGGVVLFRRVHYRVLAAVAGLLLVAPASAAANGDPASDVLLQSKVYYPVQRVSVDAATNLNAVVKSANAKGYAIRVALIHDATDLGTVPNLLNQPQKYADFLGPEVRFAYKGDLLVVMPNGLGLTTTDETPPPAKAIQGMQVEAGGVPDGLAQTAQEAVTKLSAAAGHPLESKKKSSAGGGGGAIVGILVAVALLVLGLVGAFWLRRSQPPRPAGPADGETPAP
jgi:hypothetical protein